MRTQGCAQWQVLPYRVPLRPANRVLQRIAGPPAQTHKKYPSTTLYLHPCLANVGPERPSRCREEEEKKEVGKDEIKKKSLLQRECQGQTRPCPPPGREVRQSNQVACRKVPIGDSPRESTRSLTRSLTQSPSLVWEPQPQLLYIGQGAGWVLGPRNEEWCHDGGPPPEAPQRSLPRPC